MASHEVGDGAVGRLTPSALVDGGETCGSAPIAVDDQGCHGTLSDGAAWLTPAGRSSAFPQSKSSSLDGTPDTESRHLLTASPFGHNPSTMPRRDSAIDRRPEVGSCQRLKSRKLGR